VVAPLVPLKSVLLSPPERRAEIGGRPAPPLAEEKGASTETGLSSNVAPVLPTAVAASSPNNDTASSALFRPLRASDAALAATGVVAGFASGLLGIGGGTIVTPALALFTDMNQTQVGRGAGPVE
jgi:hypothetical protein